MRTPGGRAQTGRGARQGALGRSKGLPSQAKGQPSQPKGAPRPAKGADFPAQPRAPSPSAKACCDHARLASQSAGLCNRGGSPGGGVCGGLVFRL